MHSELQTVLAPSVEPAAPATPLADDWLVRTEDLGKVYQLFDRPADRLKQALSPTRKKYYREFWALKELNFSVGRGEVLGLVGRNGSGKSTLLQILSGVLKPSTGLYQRKGRVAALLELGSGFNPEFTGRENIYMNGAILGLPRKQLEERIGQIIEFADIGPFIDQPVKTYSSGMFVRLAFSIATNVDADLLVVDEALSVGDAAFQFKCMHHVEKMVSRGTTILLVSHDPAMIRSYCTRAMYLQQGQMKYLGDCETATEMYLMELRDAQAKEFEQSIAMKASDSSAGGKIRFGNNRGQITRVTLGVGAEARTLIRAGERVWLEIEAQVDPSVKEASFYYQLRNLRAMVLYAMDTKTLGLKLRPDARGNVKVRFEFDAIVQAGHYGVTVRLSDASEPTAELLLEKQVSAAVFEVGRPGKPIFGAVDLNGSASSDFAS